MINKVVEKPITRIGVTEKKKCTIAGTAKAFQVLARQYSNPIKAIFQELSSNALDAHVRANKETVPFAVKLPNKLDPTFSIRDYGISMEHDFICNLYTTYMASDKTNTNSESGFFGLGSKTPFAYSDSFNVTAFLNGEKRMYVLAYDEQGIPELNVIGVIDTTEENGIEVSFAVKEEDFNNFCILAQEIYKFYTVKPIVTGVANFEFNKFTPTLKGTNWVRADYENLIVMGNVAYPIQSYNVCLGHKAVLNMQGIIIYCNIGEVDITPSREALEYSEKTLTALDKYLTIVQKEYMELINETLTSCDSLWSASIKAKQLCKEMAFLVFDKLTWNTKSVIPYFDVIVDSKYKTEHTYRNSNPTRVKKYVVKAYEHIHVNENTAIVIKDTGKNFNNKTRYYALCNPDKTVYLVDPALVIKGDGTTSLTSAETVQYLKEGLGINTENIITFVSELPNIPKTHTMSKGNKAISVREFLKDASGYRSRNSGRNSGARYWGDAQISFKDLKSRTDFVYVKFNRYEISSEEYSIHNFISVIQQLQILGITIPTIYGFNGQTLERAKANNFVSFYAWVKDAIKGHEETIVNSKFLAELNNIPIVESIIKLNGNLLSKFKDKKSTFSQLCNAVNSVKIGKNFEVLIDFCKMLNINLEIKDNFEHIKDLVSDVKEKYFFIAEFLSDTYNYNFKELDIAKRVIHSVNMIDSFKK